MIAGKKIVDGSCDSEKFSNVCIYFVISSWVLGLVISFINTFSEIYKKIKAWIEKRGKIVNLDEVTQVRVVTTKNFDKIN